MFDNAVQIADLKLMENDPDRTWDEEMLNWTKEAIHRKSKQVMCFQSLDGISIFATG